MLAIFLARAKSDGQIKGVIPNLVEDGLSILQYADDTMIFMDHDLDQATNLKLILGVFEQLSGLKINYHKSEIFYFGAAKDRESVYSHNLKLLAGAAALCWAIWFTRNDLVLNSRKLEIFLQVLFGERTGSGRGLCFSTLRTRRTR